MQKIFNEDEQCLFVVYKQGVYGHGVHAVGSRLTDATDLANLAAAREPDDYHSFHVFSVPMNLLPVASNEDRMKMDFRADSGWMNRASLYSVSKSPELQLPLQDHEDERICSLTVQGKLAALDQMDSYIREQIEAQLSDPSNKSWTPSEPNLNAPPLEIPSNTPLVFLVYKKGHFGHGVHGASDDLNVAMELALLAAKRDIDNYHAYEVYTVPVGYLPKQIELCSLDHGWMNREPVIAFTLDGLSPYGAKKRPTIRKSPLSDAEIAHQNKLIGHHA